MEQELELLDQVQEQIHRLEARIVERVQMTPTMQLIQSVPPYREPLPQHRLGRKSAVSFEQGQVRT